jgi:hypothetical protein
VPKHVFIEESNGSPNRRPLEIDITARVDRISPWNLPLYVTFVDGFNLGAVKTDPKFIRELRRGTTLRIKIPQNDGSNYYEAYSLMGYSRAFAKAKAACVPHGQYFNNQPRSTGNHSEYFL